MSHILLDVGKVERTAHDARNINGKRMFPLGRRDSLKKSAGVVRLPFCLLASTVAASFSPILHVAPRRTSAYEFSRRKTNERTDGRTRAA